MRTVQYVSFVITEHILMVITLPVFLALQLLTAFPVNQIQTAHYVKMDILLILYRCSASRSSAVMAWFRVYNNVTMAISWVVMVVLVVWLRQIGHVTTRIYQVLLSVCIQVNYLYN